jgi:hypothetical protein
MERLRSSRICGQIRKEEARLLALAPVAFELMTGILEVARFMRIELRFGTADFADKDMEVGRLFFVPDKSGERKFLDGHRIPPRAKHSKSDCCPLFFCVATPNRLKQFVERG